MRYHDLWRRLTPCYPEGEAKAIARLVYEVRYGLTLADLLLGKDADANDAELEDIARRLLRYEPVQYVLGCADFCGRRFQVGPGVLVPRPETEELCRWIVGERQGAQAVLDLGTGSGCIAVTLAAEMPGAAVTACDLAAEALATTQANARRIGVDITVLQRDILHLPASTDAWDVIVSNPPYICNKERATMESNVLDYEPAIALFVPDDDPLLFYRAIARYAQTALKPGGWLYFEINPHYADDLQTTLSAMHFRQVGIRNDAFEKQRFIRAQR